MRDPNLWDPKVRDLKVCDQNVRDTKSAKSKRMWSKCGGSKSTISKILNSLSLELWEISLIDWQFIVWNGKKVSLHFRLPVLLGRQLAGIAAEFRWFIAVYIFVTYIFIPGFFIILSLIDKSGTLTGVVLGIIVFLFCIKMVINFMRSRGDLRRFLPSRCQQSGSLPEWMSSLAFYDR